MQVPLEVIAWIQGESSPLRKKKKKNKKRSEWWVKRAAHSSTKTCRHAFLPVLHTPDKRSSCCCWIKMRTILLLMLFPPSGISSCTFPARRVYSKSRYQVLPKLRMGIPFHPGHWFWMIYSKNIIGAARWDCLALLQNVSRIYVISRSWNSEVKAVALSPDYQDSSSGATIGWLYDIG